MRSFVSNGRGGGNGNAVIQRQQGVLLDAAVPALRALGEKQHCKQHGEREAHEDGDSENFH